jgi:proton glutamate symport protein
MLRTLYNPPPVPFTLQVLLGLVVGLATGIAVSVSSMPWLRGIPAAAEPIGVLFVSAIRMTVIPLVAASLMLGVASTRDPKKVGRLGIRAIALILVSVSAAALFAVALGVPLLDRLTVDSRVAESLRAGTVPASVVADQAARLPGLSQWLVDLVPVNPFKAAADGAMLPLIVFSIAFGLGVTRVGGEAQASMRNVLKAVSDAMLAVVGWVLKAAPVGVCALAIGLGARMGTGAAGALAYYMLVVSVICTAFVGLVLVPAAVWIGRQELGRFVRAAAPAIGIAFSSRSSLAALPASIEGVRTGLGLPDDITSVFIPLAASIFRVGAAIAQVGAVLFLARLYGVTLGPAALGTMVVSIVFTTLTVPGIPAGAIIVLAPVLSAVGLPVEGIGILMGVDTIPDMFRTTANVVGWLAGASVLGRRTPREGATA